MAIQNRPIIVDSLFFVDDRRKFHRIGPLCSRLRQWVGTVQGFRQTRNSVSN